MIDQLPYELIEEIGEYLDPKSVLSLESTCKNTNTVKFGRYWKKLFISTFPEKNHLLYSLPLMKSLVSTRFHLTELKRNVIELKRAVDFGASCEFTNWMSLNFSIQAMITPLSILFLAPLTIAQIRDFYEYKRNTSSSAAT